MDHERTGIFENGPPVVLSASHDQSDGVDAQADALRGGRVFVRIAPSPGRTAMLVDLRWTPYDFSTREVMADLSRWHEERGLGFARPNVLDDRSEWIRSETTEQTDVAALLDVILAACQRTRQWKVLDPTLARFTKEGPPL